MLRSRDRVPSLSNPTKLLSSSGFCPKPVGWRSWVDRACVGGLGLGIRGWLRRTLCFVCCDRSPASWVGVASGSRCLCSGTPVCPGSGLLRFPACFVSRVRSPRSWLLVTSCLLRFAISHVVRLLCLQFTWLLLALEVLHTTATCCAPGTITSEGVLDRIGGNSVLSLSEVTVWQRHCSFSMDRSFQVHSYF